MTAESAKTLKDLAEAATTLMEQMDERDRRTDQSTRKQITIAVWSVVASAVSTPSAMPRTRETGVRRIAAPTMGKPWVSFFAAASRQLFIHP